MGHCRQSCEDLSRIDLARRRRKRPRDRHYLFSKPLRRIQHLGKRSRAGVADQNVGRRCTSTGPGGQVVNSPSTSIALRNRSRVVQAAKNEKRVNISKAGSAGLIGSLPPACGAAVAITLG